MKSDRIFTGWRMEDGTTRVFIGQEDLNPRLDVLHASPTGFEWGYKGSGPAQLAFAICSEACDGDTQRALAVYQVFKETFVACLSRDESWHMAESRVQAAIKYIEQTQAKFLTPRKG